MADLSMSEKQEAIRNALLKRLGGSTSLYIAEAYDDRVVYTTYAEGSPSKSWQVEYSIDDAGAVTLGDDATEVERRTVYQAVKFVDEDEGVIRGLAIPFGGPIAGKDIDGEDFGPDTDLCLEWFPEGRPILYHHGLNGAIKTDVIGRQTDVETDDEGVWVKAELNKRSRWYKRVKDLIDKEALGFSSGAMPHLVRTTKSGHITRWPWIELTLTPTNANPAAVAYAVKADPAFFTPDDDDGSGPEPFDAHAERVASEVADLVERASARIELRAGKAGRELSASNREWLRSLHERLGSFEALRREVKEALDRTDPDAKKAVAFDAHFELEVEELRRVGVLD